MARRVLVPMLFVVACCGGCYHRQLLPPTTICVQDQDGRPVSGLRGSWSGYASEDEVHDGPFAFESDGCARIPRYNLWTTPLNLVGAAIKSVSPHEGGLRSAISDIEISLPDGYEVDEAESGLTRDGRGVSGGGISWEGRDDMSLYLAYGSQPLTESEPSGASQYPTVPKPPDKFVIRLWKPGNLPALQVRLILQAKATQPARPGGAGGVR
jgi:hypothetical protein